MSEDRKEGDDIVFFFSSIDNTEGVVVCRRQRRNKVQQKRSLVNYEGVSRQIVVQKGISMLNFLRGTCASFIVMRSCVIVVHINNHRWAKGPSIYCTIGDGNTPGANKLFFPTI